jgi:rhizosphere induced protein
MPRGESSDASEREGLRTRRDGQPAAEWVSQATRTHQERTMPSATPPALATGYSLNINNQNSLLQTFVLYQTLPVTSSPSLDPIPLAWLVGSAAPGTASNPSQSTFSWEIDYAVATGYLQQEGTQSNPRKFQTVKMQPVSVNSQNTVAVTYNGLFPNGAPTFNGNPGSGTQGVIQASADDLIPSNAQALSEEMNFALGIAMNKKPAVTVQLLPNVVYEFTPHPSYFIMAAKYQPGEVIDVEENTIPYEVVFDGVTTKTLNFTEQNTFIEV